MAGCNHSYRKFNESLIFCKRCGTTKAISSGGWYYSWPQPWRWYPTTVPYWTATSTITNSADWVPTSYSANASNWAGSTTLTLAETVQKDVKPQDEPPKPKDTKTIKGVADPEVKK